LITNLISDWHFIAKDSFIIYFYIQNHFYMQNLSHVLVHDLVFMHPLEACLIFDLTKALQGGV
jgi:hypothetical protein